jgi:hypothetical protein
MRLYPAIHSLGPSRGAPAAPPDGRVAGGPLPASARDWSLRRRRCHELNLGYFEVEADNPLDDPGQRTLIWQLGAQGRGACSQGDLAVVEFCAYRGARLARLARKGDLICS